MSARAGGQSLEVARTAVLRDTPLGTALSPLPAGTIITGTGEENEDWIQVRTSDGTTGWVLKDRLK